MKYSEIPKTPTNPWPDLEFKALPEIVDMPVTVIAIEKFENQHGAGLHLRLSIEGKEYRTCTHAVNILGKLTAPGIADVLNEEGIELAFIKRQSTTSDNIVFDIV